MTRKQKKSSPLAEAMLKKFMNDRDLPDWYRGLSTFQCNAADALLNSIRDDTEQKTTHRVCAVLTRLGVVPMISPQRIKFTMKLSRGNDIAFLWFLMELYYRGRDDIETNGEIPVYSINEQIIISAIAHLDMLPTLRELNKILPINSVETPPKTKTPKKIIKKPKYVNPYYQTIQRPKPFGKSLLGKRVNYPINMGRYHNVEIERVVMPNEANRWFSEYTFHKSQRIAKGIIDLQINSVFGRPEDETEEENNENYENQVQLCSHHKTVQYYRESLANELKVLKKRACEKHLDMEAQADEQSLKRVQRMLDMEIEKLQQPFERLAHSTLLFRSTKKTGKEIKTLQTSESSPSARPSTRASSFDYGHGLPPLSKCRFFEAPQSNQPYKFNYHKIFDNGVRNPISEFTRNALECSSSIDSLDHSRHVKKLCKRMWCCAVQKYNKEYEEEKKRKKLEAMRKPSVLIPEFRMKYFDPRNSELMDKILLAGLNEIKKDRRYVLASLPNAHKYPVLKEWVKKRYGLMYSREEKIHDYLQSKSIFAILNSRDINIKIPTATDLADKESVSYSCKKYLLDKTNYLRNDYYHKYKINVLKQARIHWSIVRPYHCTQGPPTRVFFAYMPAAENDIKLFKPWKKSEFMNAKLEWDKRQRLKNQQ